jgi:alkaline phosphatase D
MLLALNACGMSPHSSLTESKAAKITHGVAIGDVQSTSAVIWSRGDREATLHVSLSPVNGGPEFDRSVAVTADHDFTGKIDFVGLKPTTTYRYSVDFGDDHGQGAIGSFTTAPAASQKQAVRFAWGGDLAGQNVCRDFLEGYPILSEINKTRWDFFIGLGDMIYGDVACEAKGRYGNTQIPGGFTEATDLPGYWAHWKYNREDPGLARLLANTPYVAVWDDHEVVNDFGPHNDTRHSPPYTPGLHLMPIGLRAFLDYNPISESPSAHNHLYRTLRWGRHVELFILDTRQYRDPKSQPDQTANPKTMLGREQLNWLKEKLKRSDATWKVIVSSVPLSVPTGYPPEQGMDGWANDEGNTGYERESLEILSFMREQGLYNNLWITTDVHFAAAFRYIPYADDPSFKVYEFISGPLSAGLFPNPRYDQTLKPERLFFYGPASPNEKLNDQQAKHWMNFGAIEVTQEGLMVVKIINAEGETVFETRLEPQ